MLDFSSSCSSAELLDVSQNAEPVIWPLCVCRFTHCCSEGAQISRGPFPWLLRYLHLPTGKIVLSSDSVSERQINATILPLDTLVRDFFYKWPPDFGGWEFRSCLIKFPVTLNYHKSGKKCWKILLDYIWCIVTLCHTGKTFFKNPFRLYYIWYIATLCHTGKTLKKNPFRLYL